MKILIRMIIGIFFMMIVGSAIFFILTTKFFLTLAAAVVVIFASWFVGEVIMTLLENDRDRFRE